MKNSEIAKIANISPSYASKIVNGKIKNKKSELVLQLLELTDNLLEDIFLDEETHNICEAVLEGKRIRKADTLRHAVKIQQIRQILLRNKK